MEQRYAKSFVFWCSVVPSFASVPYFIYKIFGGFPLLSYFCNVKRCITILFTAVLAILCLNVCLYAVEKRHVARVDSPRVHRMLDVAKPHREIPINSRQMASSVFPVRMVVKGSALCVTSEYSQILPIYTRGGSFYMAMRLNKGLNWLNGLPRGRYLINYKQISIP